MCKKTMVCISVEKLSLVNFVDVTSYTKNQAVKNSPIPSKTSVSVANIAGFTGLTYRAIDSMLS